MISNFIRNRCVLAQLYLTKKISFKFSKKGKLANKEYV